MGSYDATFTCGLLRVRDRRGLDPDWDEFKGRIDFVREARGLRVRFLEAFRDERGDWEVPFFAACHEGLTSRSAKEVLEGNTPYEVSEYKAVEPATANLETLSILRGLVSDEGTPSWIHEVIPGSAARPKHPEDVFDGLVGMTEQRLRLMKLARVVATCGRDAIDCFHLVFAGNPGTGKSELATRLASYLDLIGVTDGTGRFVKVGEADLVAKYVGHTAPRVKSVVESALGGLLLIDEFYAIANAPHFGREAIDCLVDQLDAHRHDFVCVVAGYPVEVDATLDLNPGLRDRFGYRIDFPDYTVDELAEIFCRMAADRGFAVACRDELAPALERLRGSRGFSNARSVRRLVDHAICEACWEHGDQVLRAEDLSMALGQCVRGRRPSVGFSD